MKIIVIHYSKDDFKLCKIEIKNEFMWCKPKGGIWTSPVESKYGWDKWCQDERFCDTNELTKVEMVIDVNDVNDVDESGNKKNLIVIDKEEDLNKLLWTSRPGIREFAEKHDLKIPFGMECFIDFEKMKENGIDAIFLTEQGQRKTRSPMCSKNLHGWDCETILLLNERCIKSWRILNKKEG